MTRPLKGYVVFDLETETNTYMGRKASPFTPDNWVVAAAYKAQGGAVAGSYYGEDRRGFVGWFKALLEAHWPAFIVGFNIKFDILWSLRDDPDTYALYQQWVAEGGQIWDGQLGEYLLDGMVPESHMLSLDEVSPKYGGETKIDEVRAMWAQGIPTHKIPRQLLMDYLTGRDGQGGDILNTEKVFLGQLAAAKKVGQAKSILLNMGALLASIEMERNGLHVDSELGRKQASLLREQSASLTASLMTYLPTDLPFEFNFRSRVHLSALIFGGRIPYKQRVHQMNDDGTLAYATMDETHSVLTDGTLVRDASTVPDEKLVRFSGGKQAGQVKTKKVKVPDPTKPKLKWEDFSYPMKGFTAPNKAWAGSTPGAYSTKAEVIQELGATTDVPFLVELAKLGAIMKDLGTYYINEEFDEEGNVTKSKGMLTLVQPDGIVHHSVNHTTTVTARLSHNNPNMGNLPREDTSDVKLMFTSRWGDEGEMTSSDFKSLEVYCQANLTDDRQLVADLRDGLDMHIARLSTVEGMPYSDVYAKVFEEKLHVWIVKRKNIKTFSFQR